MAVGRDFADLGNEAGDEDVRAAIDGARPSGRYTDYGADTADWPNAGTIAARAVKATPHVRRDPATIPVRPWVYGRWFLRGTVTAVVAPGGVGKTNLLAGTALALVTGSSLLGKAVWDRPQRVWIWILEDDLDELTRAIEASAKHHGIALEDALEGLFVDSAMSGATLCTATDDGGDFRIVEPVVAAIAAELIARRIDVLIVDPFVSSHEVDENANVKIDKITKRWARVAVVANCSVVLVHHTKKLGGLKVTAEASRGAVALIWAARSALVLNRMDDDEAKRFGIEGEDERQRYFSVFDDKHNRAPAEKADWYHLASVDLDNGGMGYGDSVGVAETWAPPDPFEGLTGSHLLRVQVAISEGQWRDHHAADQWVGRAVAAALALDADDPAGKARILQLLKTWKREHALKVVQGKDERRKPVNFVEVDQWQNDPTAPPRISGAEQGGATTTQSCSAPPATMERVVERSGSTTPAQVERSAARYPHGNRALRPILAPGEAADDAVPGWDS